MMIYGAAKTFQLTVCAFEFKHIALAFPLD